VRVEIIFLSIALLILLVASIIDIKKHLVPLIFPILLFLVGLSMVIYILIDSGTWTHALMALCYMAVFSAVGILYFIFSKWGGADTKAMPGLGFLVSSQFLFWGAFGFLISLMIFTYFLFLFNGKKKRYMAFYPVFFLTLLIQLLLGIFIS